MGDTTTVTRLAGTPNAVTTTFTYEPMFNRVATIADPLNHTTTLTHDSQGNVTAIADALGQETTLAYNATGHPTSMTTPAGVTQFGYVSGDVVAVTNPLGQVTRRFVDAAGRVTMVRNAFGQKTRFTYDELNRITALTDSVGNSIQFNYDANGNVLQVIDARRNVTTYAYNGMDRVTSRTDPLARSETYGYDNNGNRTSAIDRKSQAKELTYDALDRPTLVSYADGSTISYTYDAGDRITQVVDSIGGTITLTYDGLDRLLTETTSLGTVVYTYDAADRRTSMIAPNQSQVSYAYDNADRLTSITQGTSVVSFTYDNAGRRASHTLPNTVVTEHAYDAASRLTGLTYKLGDNTLGNLTYSYNDVGHRVAVGGTWARTGLPQAVAAATYDAANRQLTFGSGSLTYDFNGNLTSDGSNIYTWNPRDQLIAMGGSATGSFSYDALGRRTRKTINAVTTEFVYDRVNPVQELSAGSIANLLAGLGIDEYFSRSDATGTRAFHTDVLGSILALTDSGAAIQGEYTYDPFGGTSVSGAAGNNSLQYTGRENDGTGLYYYRARYYHPGLQRFIGEDPLGFSGGDLNVYAYVANVPTRFRDPLGLYMSWDHRDLTVEEAEKCGFSRRDAKRLGGANERIDTRHPESWLSNKNPWHAMPGTNYQPIIDRQLQRAINESNWDQALDELGKGSHPVQDQWAHDRNQLGGDIHAHSRGWWEGNPDNPASNPENWKRAREDTRSYFRDFMRGRGLKPQC